MGSGVIVALLAIIFILLGIVFGIVAIDSSYFDEINPLIVYN